MVGRVPGRDDPLWVRKWGYSSYNPPPLWVSHVLARDPVLLRQTKRRQTCERIIGAFRIGAGLYPLPPLKPSRGRPPAPHPLPRREKKTFEEFDRRTHKEKHKTVFVTGCPHCYQREYLYYFHHPELRPKDRWTAGCRELIRGIFTDIAPRRWIDEGWKEYEDRMKANKNKVEVLK